MRGQYIYLKNGQPTGIHETWELDSLSAQRLIRSERRMIGAILSVSSVEADGLFTHCDIRYQSADINIAAQYQFNDCTFHIARILNGQHETHTLTAEAPFIFSPLMRIYTGRVIHQLAQSGKPTQVLVPWLYDPTQFDRFLLPHFDTRRARLLTHEHDTDVYEYIGEQYDDTARFWVNPEEILARYTWQQGDTTWDVQLVKSFLSH